MFGTLPSGLRAPGRVLVRIAAATLTTSPPSSSPTLFFVSRQSISYPIPARGLTLPPHALEEEREPPRLVSTTCRAAPGKSDETTADRGPIVTGWAE